MSLLYKYQYCGYLRPLNSMFLQIEIQYQFVVWEELRILGKIMEVRLRLLFKQMHSISLLLNFEISFFFSIIGYIELMAWPYDI